MAIDSGGGSGISEEDLFFEVAFGEGFESAVDFDTTADRIINATTFEREDVPPEVVQPWECRIGGCLFFIPPINIDVQQRYKTGSLTGGALRQPSSPKFNSGHTETVITMTLYFPTMESVFGVEDSIFDINFDENGNDKRIDKFLSSLRGLIAQFRYAPFLPIRNAYLNRVFDVTGVALKDMTISTVPNFPFCMAVTLTLYKFNHKAYLPMVEHFDQAMHWGRYRSFMGRAAIRMAQSAKPMKVWSEAMGVEIETGQVDFPVKAPSTVLEDADQNYDQGSKFTFRKPTAADASIFEFYYPFQTPTRLEVPDLDDLRPADPQLETRKRSWWENLLGVLGVETSVYPEAQYNTAREIAEDQGTGYYSGLNEDKILYNYLKRVDIAFKDMGPGRLEEYIKKRQDELDIPPGSGAAQELRVEITRLWFYTLMRFMLEDPSLAAALANENRRKRQITFDEWEIPLKKLNLDWDAVDVQGVAVTMGNVLSSLQLQLQGETTYQHIGGEDTRIDISLIVSGANAEDELVRLRTMFDSISGLARLAQNHGVLGFLGVKNLITELVGVRYVVPLNFNVSTVPNFPHAYQVEISLVDFDVFQQRREQLTAEQQAELVEAFGKNNPFLRLKQLWGHFNGYPDFPLAVRDDEGKIVGHLEPDFYFRAFKAIDDDLVTVDKYEKARVDQTKKARVKDALDQYDQGRKNWQDKKDNAESTSYEDIMNEDGNHINFGMVNGEPQIATVNDRGITLRSGNETVMRDTPITEAHGGMVKESYVDGLTPPAGHTEPYAGGDSDPRGQFELMARDMQYRDKSGRMVRAFPTYMLWLIDEGGTFGGFKLFDNFYGLQSVIDMSIVRSEDIMADTLVIRLSNLYSKLSTNFSAYLDEENSASRIINEFTTRNLRILSGASEYMVELDTMRLKPGVRMHLRLGYGSNPNSLETVFNGTITDVQQGDIITVVAQSDAVELGAPVNNTNKDGHSGRIDGNLTGLYLSEPRDLMLAMLTKGSSIVREVIAHATKGQIFSENRYGIKHFGLMKYTHMGAAERDKNDRQKETLRARVEKNAEDGNGIVGQFFHTAMLTILNDAWANLATHRDYEIFKRNIYPGNGLGVAQFLGGDMGDVFETRGAFDGKKALVDGAGFGPGGEAQATDPLTGSPIDIDISLNREELNEFNTKDPHYKEEQTREVARNMSPSRAPRPPNAAYTTLEDDIANKGHGRDIDWFKELNISSRYDDDEIPEVSFRAQTYMKTVWDMFKICAALLPDYIVAVRPFEERSTVFYGKPHWLYTSGVIPLSKGVKPADAPPLAEPNEEWKKIYNDLEEQANRRDEIFKEDLIGAVKATAGNYNSGSDPSSSRDGMQFNGSKESILALPTALPSGMQLPHSEGGTGIEMHLPTSGNLQEDISQHKQLEGLPENLKHPFYMDRGGSDVGKKGGYVKTNQYDPSKNPLKQTILRGENPDNPGKPGAAGFLNPEEEQWYMNMRWVGAGGQARGWLKVWRGRKILVYCPKTNRAVVCTPAEYGPAKVVVQRGVVSGVSPDAWFALGEPKHGDNCYYRVMPDDFPLGPLDDITGAASSTNVSSGASSTYDGGLVAGNDVPGREQVKMTTGQVDLPSWAEGHGAKDIDQIAFEEGWKVAGIPVNYTKAEGVEGIHVNEDGIPVDSGVNSDTIYIHYDKIGLQARQAYIHQVSEVEANDIWDEVREHFADDSAGWVGDDQTVEIFNKWLEEHDIETDNKDGLRRRLVDGFLKYMWQRPHARGWIPKVVHPAGDLSQTFIPPSVGDPDLPGQRDWNLAPVYDAFGAYLTGEVLTNDGRVIDNPNIENTKLEAFMRLNQKDGYDQAGYFGKAVEAVGKRVHDVGTSVGRIAKALFTVGGGLLSYLRMSLFQVSHGLMLSSSMQKNSNIINNIYNDSIYYSAGVKDGKVENPLLFYADNPFTREYGEPVAEVREPFQRLHTINSIRHIVSNNIQESLNDVATVVTAVSNNADPVTVHFDKGIPSERQREITIETGLHYDDPGWLSWIWNPTSQMREWKQKGMFGFIGGEKVSPPELNAKRVALWHLKENLKDIYQGEVVVLGDPTIRPYDLVYMYDAYENISGFFEVEQVVHHFTPETGFITSITPNACVSINDPGRFYLWANRQRTESIDDVRTKIREVLQVRADNNPEGSGEEYLDVDVLEETLAKELTNSAQYFGGMGKVIGAMGASWVVGGPIGAFIGWQMWQYVRDNLLDQHGCYINYLTRDGKPMDGGLSHNQGVAVGHQRSLGVMLGALKIGEVSTIDQDGNAKIRTSEVIPALKWDEYGPNEYAREVDIFVDATLAEIRKQSGRGGDLIAEDSGVEVFWVKIVKVKDVDTFEVQLLEHMNFGRLAPAQNFALGDTIRLAGAQGVEDDYKNDELLSAIHIDDLGVQGTEFARTVLEGQEVALRVSRYKSFRKEKYGRTLAYVFHNAPESALNPAQRKSYLINVAGASTPLAAWNSYTEDGKPHTFDWELIVRGFGDTYSGDLERSLPGHGVHGDAKDVIPRDRYGGESGGGIIR